MHINSYPSIFTLGHRALAELFLDEVLVEEKVDGSQFSMMRKDGELFCRSKGADINVEFPEKMFAAAVEVAKTLDLKDGWVYRGEYLQKPKHNALAYNRTPEKHIIIFDINPGLEEYLTTEEKEAEARRIGLECVPAFYRGRITDPNTLLDFLQTESVLGGQKIEGMVIKNYRRFGPDKKALMGKYVSEAFKEVHAATWGAANPNQRDILQQLILAYRTPARWSKVVMHLKEREELTDTPKDIGLLIKEVREDITKECAEEIKDKLYKQFIDGIMRGATGGLPEWYKEQLLKLQFEQTPISAPEFGGDIHPPENESTTSGAQHG